MALRTGDRLMNLFKKVPGWKILSEDELMKLKQELVDIASDFTECCEKNNLNYMMGAGTALGAVRHNGFIPWDDDMDFHMPRKDYNKFLEIAEKYLGHKYIFKSNAKGDKVPYPSIHMIRRGTRYLNYADLISTMKVPLEEQGIYIDIIPYDNVSNIKIFRYIKETIGLFLYFIASCVDLRNTILYFEENALSMTRGDYDAMKLKIWIGRLFGFWPEWKWMCLIDRFATSNHNDNSKWVTCYVGKKIDKYTHLRIDLWGENREEFEGHRWKIANNPDKYLTKEYSKDYMIPPPIDKRKIHPVFELQFSDGTKL